MESIQNRQKNRNRMTEKKDILW